jgi:ABC-2 type transport system ATP-binding protein
VIWLLTDSILSVRALRKRYGNKEAVGGISFDVATGEIFGILGPNGAGKTTAIRMMMGVLRPDAGEVRFHYGDGESSSLDRTLLGYLPEERGLYDDVPILRSLTYLGELKGIPAPESRKRAEHWLETMVLKEYANTKLEKLSKGMQQKVQFIAAVLHKPPLLLLDEPFSGLDPVNQDLFKGLIRKLQKEGTTILLSAHQMNMVEELCSRIFMIHQGEEVLYGKVQDIKDNYHEYSVQLSFGNGHAAESHIRNHPGVRNVLISDNDYMFRLSTKTEVNGFLAELTRLGELTRIQIQKPSLHEIFVQTVADRGVKA